MINTASRRLSLVYLLTALLAFAYIVVRAFTVAITYDEAWTLKWFVPLPWMDVINYSPSGANNHLLNTLLIKLLYTTGSTAVWLARIPNVLAGMLYLYFAWRITRKFMTPFMGICCFLLLVLNPFLLDFFSLARGYGLSLGFQLWAVWFLLRFLSEKRQQFALLALITGALAVLSSFTLLLFWLAVFAVVTGLPLFFRKLYPERKKAWFNLLVLLGLVAIIYEPIRKLKQNGDLYYGGTTGFYSDTLVSLAKYTGYSTDESPGIFLALNLFLVLLGAVLIASYAFRRTLLTPKNALLTVLLLCCAAIILQHVLLDTLYVIDRAALYLYPLALLVLCFALGELPERWPVKVLGAATVAAFAINFFAHVNTYKTATWYFDAHTKTVLEALNNKGKNAHRVLKIDYSWPFNSVLDFHINAGSYPFVERVNRAPGVDTVKTDYYIYLSRPLEIGYFPKDELVHQHRKQLFKRYEDVSVYRIVD